MSAKTQQIDALSFALPLSKLQIDRLLCARRAAMVVVVVVHREAGLDSDLERISS